MAPAARLRLAAIAVLILSAVVYAPEASPATRNSSRASLAAFESGVVFKLNTIRRSHGLVPLTLNKALSVASLQHSQEMLADGYFAHNSADGSAFWKRIRRYYPVGQYTTWAVGENLLWTGGPITVVEAVDLWMASPEHRANILMARWREIGIAALQQASGSGVFGGSSVTVVATDFGARS